PNDREIPNLSVTNFFVVARAYAEHDLEELLPVISRQPAAREPVPFRIILDFNRTKHVLGDVIGDADSEARRLKLPDEPVCRTTDPPVAIEIAIPAKVGKQKLAIRPHNAASLAHELFDVAIMLRGPNG